MRFIAILREFISEVISNSGIKSQDSRSKNYCEEFGRNLLAEIALGKGNTVTNKEFLEDVGLQF